MIEINTIVDRMIDADPYLRAHRSALTRRLEHIQGVHERITEGRMDLLDLAAGHEYFGLHQTDGRSGSGRPTPRPSIWWETFADGLKIMLSACRG